MDIKYYRRLKNVDRLGIEAKLREYNLLEHQYMVAMLFRHFACKEDVAYDILIFDIILHHDIVETVTSDIPYPVKNFNSKTVECWSIIEQEVIQHHEQLIRYTDKNIENAMTPKQFSLFKVCDLLDLWIFLREEQTMGNNNNECKKIIKTCEKLIKGKFKTIDIYMKTYEHDKF